MDWIAIAAAVTVMLFLTATMVWAVCDHRRRQRANRALKVWLDADGNRVDKRGRRVWPMRRG